MSFATCPKEGTVVTEVAKWVGWLGWVVLTNTFYFFWGVKLDGCVHRNCFCPFWKTNDPFKLFSFLLKNLFVPLRIYKIQINSLISRLNGPIYHFY